MIKPVVKKEEEAALSTLPNNTTEIQDTREPSPELARISALITRPPKSKASSKTVDCDSDLHVTDDLFLPPSTANVLDKSPRHPTTSNDSTSPPAHTKLKKFRTMSKIKSRDIKRAGEPEPVVTDNNIQIPPSAPVSAPEAFYLVSISDSHYVTGQI